MNTTGSRNGALGEIRIDRELCTGSGSCSFHAPGTFDLDDDDMKVLLLDGRDSADAIIAAVDSCPSGALSLASAPQTTPTDTTT